MFLVQNRVWSKSRLTEEYMQFQGLEALFPLGRVGNNKNWTLSRQSLSDLITNCSLDDID